MTALNGLLRVTPIRYVHDFPSAERFSPPATIHDFGLKTERDTVTPRLPPSSEHGGRSERDHLA